MTVLLLLLIALATTAAVVVLGAGVIALHRVATELHHLNTTAETVDRGLVADRNLKARLLG